MGNWNKVPCSELHAVSLKGVLAGTWVESEGYPKKSSRLTSRF